jgi:hypothetical protein
MRPTTTNDAALRRNRAESGYAYDTAPPVADAGIAQSVKALLAKAPMPNATQ